MRRRGACGRPASFPAPDPGRLQVRFQLREHFDQRCVEPCHHRVGRRRRHLDPLAAPPRTPSNGPRGAGRRDFGAGLDGPSLRCTFTGRDKGRGIDETDSVRSRGRPRPRAGVRARPRELSGPGRSLRDRRRARSGEVRAEGPRRVVRQHRPGRAAARRSRGPRGLRAGRAGSRRRDVRRPARERDRHPGRDAAGAGLRPGAGGVRPQRRPGVRARAGQPLALLDPFDRRRQELRRPVPCRGRRRAARCARLLRRDVVGGEALRGVHRGRPGGRAGPALHAQHRHGADLDGAGHARRLGRSELRGLRRRDRRGSGGSRRGDLCRRRGNRSVGSREHQRRRFLERGRARGRGCRREHIPRARPGHRHRRHRQRLRRLPAESRRRDEGLDGALARTRGPPSSRRSRWAPDRGPARERPTSR